jgi:predicted RNA binding protein YcfA (HicA-like mRNA interferase family)
MAKLPVLSAREVLKALERAPVVPVAQKGSRKRLNGTWRG